MFACTFGMCIKLLLDLTSLEEGRERHWLWPINKILDIQLFLWR